MVKSMFSQFYGILDYLDRHDEYVTEYQAGEVAWLESFPATVSLGVKFYVAGIEDEEPHAFKVVFVGAEGHPIAETEERKFVRMAMTDGELYPEARVRLDGRFKNLKLDGPGQYIAMLKVDGNAVGQVELLVYRLEGLEDREDVRGNMLFDQEAHEVYYTGEAAEE